jgi:hypothetical protein
MRRRAAASAACGPPDPPAARERPHADQLWLPVTPVFWLLAPFAHAAGAADPARAAVRGLNPYGPPPAVGRVLLA